MSESFIWDDRLETGDLTIDNQHRRIISLANEINASFEEKDLKRKMMEVYDYTREHFRHEEKLMQESDFPDLKSHMKEHNELLSQLNKLVDNLSSTEEDCETLRKIVVGWVREHVLHSDLKMTEFLRV